MPQRAIRNFKGREEEPPQAAPTLIACAARTHPVFSIKMYLLQMQLSLVQFKAILAKVVGQTRVTWRDSAFILPKSWFFSLSCTSIVSQPADSFSLALSPDSQLAKFPLRVRCDPLFDLFAFGCSPNMPCSQRPPFADAFD